MQNKSKSEYPLVSIFCFCKNRAKTIRRCIDSIVTQDYPNIEIIIQDGASTDGTLEILQSYGNKIKLVSEPDSSPTEGFSRALARIRGEFFGSCLSDEELMPGAVSWGVENLLKNPEAAAIYGDLYLTDIDGNIIGGKHPSVPWDYEKYFCSEITPPFCSSFFRTACYKALGFHDYTGGDEFDIWINLGARFPIYYVPGMAVAKYAIHDEELGRQKHRCETGLISRKSAIEKLCNNPQTPQWIRLLHDKAIASLYPWMAIGNCKTGAWDLAKKNAPEAFRIGPNSEKLKKLAELLHQHSMKLYQEGNLEEALQYLELSIQGEIATKGVNYQRANILFQLGRINEASKASYEELKLQPDHRRAKAIISIAKNYPEGTSKPPNEIMAKELFKIGVKYLSQGNAMEAIRYFKESVVDRVTLPELHFAYATALAQLGIFGTAKAACLTELKLQPEHRAVKNLLKRIEKAIAEYDKIPDSYAEIQVNSIK